MRSYLPGLAACIAIASVAFACGRLLPVVGAPVFAIVIGALVATFAPRALGPQLRPGAARAGKTVLQASIVILGATLDLRAISRTSVESLPVTVGTLAVALAAAAIVGRWLGIDGKLRTLIGVGTAICGASAIAAVSGVIEASESEIAYAISTVFLYNVAAVLIFPPVGHLMGLSHHAFALWAGTAINDTSSVVAAGFAYGPDAGSEAIVVKLARTLWIIPIVVGLALARLRAPHAAKRPSWRKIFPLFIVWFVLAALANSIGIIPAQAHGAISATALILIVVALAGVGLASDVERMVRTGVRPIAFGAILWALVSLTSLAIQRAFG